MSCLNVALPFLWNFVAREAHLQTELETEFGLEEEKENGD